MSGGTRLYRLLLHLYPRRFRDAYEQELIDAFQAQRHEARYRHRGRFDVFGALGLLRFWTDILADLAISVIRTRARAARPFRTAHAARSTTSHDRDRERSQPDAMLHDFRYSLRLLRRRPASTVVAVLSLALGIGGTSLIFGLVDALVLRPFAYPAPDRLVAIASRFPQVDASEERAIEALSPAEALDIARAKTLTGVQAFDLGNRHVSGGAQPERLFTALVFGDLFPTLGLRPHLGRGFSPDELQPGGRQAAIISHRVWRSLFGADPAIIGRDLRVNGTSRTIVGVMPPEVLLVGTDLWLPIQASPAQWPRPARNFTVLARLAPDATPAAAQAELDTIAASTTASFGVVHKEYNGWGLTAIPLADVFTKSLRPAAYLILGAIGFVLLIVCVNLANLQIARASTRQRELAVRLALGAGRWRIARQLLIESLLLSGAGGALGVMLAIGGLRTSAALLPAHVVSRDPNIAFSGRVLLVSLAATLAAAILVGLIPALRTSRTDPYDALKRDSRQATAGAATNRLRQGLIVAEIALTMILLVGAGLLTRTMLRLSQVEPGLDVRNVLTMRLTLPREKYQGPAGPAFFDQLIARVQALPGVRGAAAASQYPPDYFFRNSIRVEGRDETASGAVLPQADMTVASPGLLRTLGIPLRAGRDFSTDDRDTAPRVAIVNAAFVRRFYHDESPLGRRIAWGGTDAPRWMTIVGVAADTRAHGVLSEISPEVYVPARQNDIWNQLFLLIRTEGNPRAVLPLVRREIVALDRDQPAYAIQTMEDAFARTLFTQRR